MPAPVGKRRWIPSGRLRLGERLAWVLVVAVWSGTGQARTWRVPADAPTVQAGIDSAQAGDDVLLAPGTYTWTSEGATGFSMLRIAKSGLTLHSEAGAEATILDAEFQWRVLRCEDVGDLVIEGLMFKDGVSKVEIPSGSEPGVASHDTNGGAIYVSGNSRPTIRRCIFRGNSAEVGGSSFGGAIKCDAAVIEGCEFTINRAGAVFGNGFGGAIDCGAAQITDCVFRGNRSLGDGSAGGGAIHSFGAIITRCVFESNSTGAHVGAAGGAILDIGGIRIESCVFAENRSSASSMSCSGGAISISRGSISKSLFIGNEARASFFAVPRGGAIAGGQLEVTGCVFLANAALVSPSGPGFGGAIRAFEASVIEGCTFIANSGGEASGVGTISMVAPGTVRSVIIAWTGPGVACLGDATWSCSNLFGNAGGDAICGTDGGGNFSSDPQFCAADPVASQSVTIQSDSPCAPGNHPAGASCGLIGAGPVACGTVGVEAQTWSRVKELYRD